MTELVALIAKLEERMSNCHMELKDELSRINSTQGIMAHRIEDMHKVLHGNGQSGLVEKQSQLDNKVEKYKWLFIIGMLLLSSAAGGGSLALFRVLGDLAKILH